MITYIVTKGEYSDYYICGVFSTKEKAQLAIDKGWVEGEIEEHETDVNYQDFPILDKGWRIWEVCFDAFGNIKNIHEESKNESHRELAKAHLETNGFRWKVVLLEDRRSAKISPGRKEIRVNLLSPNKEHAIKSASEKRAFAIANPALCKNIFHDIRTLTEIKDSDYKDKE